MEIFSKKQSILEKGEWYCNLLIGLYYCMNEEVCQSDLKRHNCEQLTAINECRNWLAQSSSNLIGLNLEWRDGWIWIDTYIACEVSKCILHEEFRRGKSPLLLSKISLAKRQRGKVICSGSRCNYFVLYLLNKQNIIFFSSFFVPEILTK